MVWRWTVIGALLAACGKPYWVATDPSALEFHIAQHRCELSLVTSKDPKHRAASRISRSEVVVGNPDDQFAMEREFRKCMRDFGYRRVVLSEDEFEALVEQYRQAAQMGPHPAPGAEVPAEK